MLNFPTVGKITQDSVSLVCSHPDDSYEVDFKKCSQALDAVNETYNDVVWGAPLNEKCDFRFYKKFFTVEVSFHNSDDILEITCLNHLKELAEHC